MPTCLGSGLESESAFLSVCWQVLGGLLMRPPAGGKGDGRPVLAPRTDRADQHVAGQPPSPISCRRRPVGTVLIGFRPF